jgi:CheY-like chemotaxis protein
MIMHRLETILLIDDDFTTNFLHQKIISKTEIDAPVEVTNNASEGLDKLLELNETIDDHSALVLVFLDLNMPLLDGWGFLEIFKEMKLNFQIHLFIVSASINPDDKTRAKSYPQVNGYLQKHLTVATFRQLSTNYA